MFETIGKLFTIAFWGYAIFIFLCGAFMCVVNIFSSNGWKKFVSILAAIIGIYVFYRMYIWSGSIGWCLFVTGIVLFIIRVPEPGEAAASTTQKEPKYGLEQALVDTICEEMLIEEAVTNAIRKSKD